MWLTGIKKKGLNGPFFNVGVKMIKYFEKRAKNSVNGATTEEMKQGFSNENHDEPEMTFKDFFSKRDYGGVVGRPEGEER